MMDMGKGNTVAGLAGNGIRVPVSKKMKKRKELDALVSRYSGRRSSCNGNLDNSGCTNKKRGVSPQDQLLSDSTEEDYWSGLRDKNGIRRGYSGSQRGSHHKRNSCNSALRFCSSFILVASIIATLIIMWLFTDIKEQATYLRNQLDQVSAENKGIPDAIQHYHSLSKQIQNNQTTIFLKISSISDFLKNCSEQIKILKSDFAKCKKKIDDSPEYTKVPNSIDALSASVASIGSDVQDLKISFTKLSENQKQIENAVNLMKNDNYEINQTMNDFIKLKEVYKHIENINLSNMTNVNKTVQNEEKLVLLNNIIENIKLNLTGINDTISLKINWISGEQHKDHMFIDALQEMSANLSARVTTLHSSSEEHESQIQLFKTSILKISDELSNNTKTLMQRVNSLYGQLNIIGNRCQRIENDTSKLNAEIGTLRQSMTTEDGFFEFTNNVTLSNNTLGSIH